MQKIKSIIITLITSFFVTIIALYLISAVLFFLFLLNFVSIENLSRQDWFFGVFGLLFIIFFITSFIIIFKAIKRKNFIYHLFRPTQKKLLINLIILIALSIITLAVFPQQFSFYREHLSSNSFLLIFWGIVSSFFLNYPFSVICYTFYYSFFKDSKETKLGKPLTLLLIFLLNPLVLGLGFQIFSSLEYQARIASGELIECGVRVTIEDGGAAYEAGVHSDEIISKVNDTSIKSVKDLAGYLGQLKEEKTLEVQTNLRTYTVTPKKDSSIGRYTFGVMAYQEYCKK